MAKSPSVLACAVAVRRCCVSIASSPKYAPGLSVAKTTVQSRFLICTQPFLMKYMQSPGSFIRKR